MPEQMSDDRFVRWQSRTIEQLGYAINLVLGLSVAALGFEVSLLLNNSFDFGLRWERLALLLSIILLSISSLCGTVAVVTRLLDFRATAQTTRSADRIEKGRYRVRADVLGRFTWCFFSMQVGSFGIGIALAGLRFAALAINKLV